MANLERGTARAKADAPSLAGRSVGGLCLFPERKRRDRQGVTLAASGGDGLILVRVQYKSANFRLQFGGVDTWFPSRLNCGYADAVKTIAQTTGGCATNAVEPVVGPTLRPGN